MSNDTKPEYRDQYAKRFYGMSMFWEESAAETRREFQNMKFKKKNPNDPNSGGHTSKKKFDEYRRMVFGYSKMYESNAQLCLAVANALENNEELIDISKEGKGGFSIVSDLTKTLADRLTGRDLTDKK